MEQIRSRVAGLDVHRDTVVACARVPGQATHKKRFKATSAGLGELTTWLVGHGIETEAMEATGVYWKPVYCALEAVIGEV